MECRRGNNKKKGIVVSNSFVFVFGLIINNWWFRLAQRRAPEAKAKSIIFVNPLSQFAGGFLIPKTIEKRQLWKWHQPGQGMLSCRCWHTPPIPLFVSTQLCRSKFTGRLLFQICSSTLLLLYSASFFFNLLFVAWCSLNLNFSYDLVNGFIFLSVVSILVLFIN